MTSHGDGDSKDNGDMRPREDKHLIQIESESTIPQITNHSSTQDADRKVIRLKCNLMGVMICIFIYIESLKRVESVRMFEVVRNKLVSCNSK